MTLNVETVVIGAGVIGLACARALAQTGREVFLLEAEPTVGTGVSSRNSEVVHAGLYYPAGSRKARTCIAGRRRLYAYCDARGVPYQRTGKLIVATDPSQLAALDGIARHAAANGVDDLKRLDATAAMDLEPHLHCVGALHSPSTGIVDSHALMRALLADAEAAGATLALRAPVRGGDARSSGIVLDLGDETGTRLVAAEVVNAAGLAAPQVARAIRGPHERLVPNEYYAKGSYFALAAPSPFARLVYPVPEPGGLGVHLTLDLAGRARFGPDVEWADAPGYDVEPARAERFYASIRRYWPALPDGALAPDYAGVRPKIVGPGAAAADFRIDGPAEHGVDRLVHLFGIESPGLTACLALADEVLALLAHRAAR